MLPLLLLSVPTGCSDSDHQGGGGCSAPLIGCAPPPPASAATGNATAFRASLSPLLAALPSAASAEEGFAAALRSQPQPDDAGHAHDRAHALGIRFGGSGDGASDSCHACLLAAVAAEAGEGCADDTRRVGVWSDGGCLLAYYAGGGDDNVASSSASDDGTRSHADGRWVFVDAAIYD